MFFKKNFFLEKNYNKKKNWYIVDASNIALGRLASKISHIIQGKHKSEYYRNIDIGDYVIVINMDNILFTGNKLENKLYYKHTGYIGGIKKIKLKDMLKINYKNVLIKAVKGMLPRNKLSNLMIKRLKIYKNSCHNHNSQKPKNLNL